MPSAEPLGAHFTLKRGPPAGGLRGGGTGQPFSAPPGGLEAPLIDDMTAKGEWPMKFWIEAVV